MQIKHSDVSLKITLFLMKITTNHITDKEMLVRVISIEAPKILINMLP